MSLSNHERTAFKQLRPNAIGYNRTTLPMTLRPFNCRLILIWRLVILTLSLPKGKNLTLARETLHYAQGDN